MHIKKVQEILESNRALHPFIKSIGIYYANSNRIIADFGASKAENLYEEFLIGEEVVQDFYEWQSIVDEHQTRRLYPSGNELVYVQTINDVEVAGNVVIMVVLKRNDIISEFVDTQNDTLNTYIMLNKQGEIVFTTNNGVLREAIKNGDVDLLKKFQHTSGMMVSTLTSKNSHLTHIYGIHSGNTLAFLQNEPTKKNTPRKTLPPLQTAPRKSITTKRCGNMSGEPANRHIRKYPEG